jgi:hypothetical protein
MFQFRIDVFDVDLTVQRVIRDREGDYIELMYTSIRNTRATREWFSEAVKISASGEIANITVLDKRMLVQLSPSTNPDVIEELLNRFFEVANTMAANISDEDKTSLFIEDDFNAMAVPSSCRWDVHNK